MFNEIVDISGTKVGVGHPVFIIAEIGSNHSQDIMKAKSLIDEAAEAGANAVKFQSIKFSEMYDINRDLCNNELQSLFKQIELKEEWYEELAAHCKSAGILFFSCPTYRKAIDLLEKVDVELFKIASPQTACYPQIIEETAATDKPLIMSTGYCNADEIDRAVKVVKKTGNRNLILLHCVSEYPTPPERANIRFMGTLRSRYCVPVGFSDHTEGRDITLAAVAAGANVIEKHITIFRGGKGPDHHFALEPHEFKYMVRSLRRMEEVLGSAEKKEITSEEVRTVAQFRTLALAKRDIKIGTVISKTEDIVFRRSVHGIDAWKIYVADSLVARRDIKKNEPLTYKCVDIK